MGEGPEAMTQHGTELDDEDAHEEDEEDEPDGFQLEPGHHPDFFLRVPMARPDRVVELRADGPLYVETVFLELQYQDDDNKHQIQHEEAGRHLENTDLMEHNYL